MKRTIIFSAFFTIFILVGVSSAQTLNVKLTFSEAINPNGEAIATVTYTGLENPNLQIFESVVRASTEAECFASDGFATARVVGPDRATLVYDRATSLYKLSWKLGRDKINTCRVVRVAQNPLSAGDLADWQANYGTGGRAANENPKDDPPTARSGDGSVRAVRYQVLRYPTN
jgi:hypothetical protein